MTSAAEYSCAFCGKGTNTVALLIRGRSDNCICDECIILCHDIVMERQALEDAQRRAGEHATSAPHASRLKAAIAMHAVAGWLWRWRHRAMT